MSAASKACQQQVNHVSSKESMPAAVSAASKACPLQINQGSTKLSR
jgi:hypothetical protein